MPIITENNYTFTSADGATPIHVREWVPDCDINGVVQLAHGINEYIGRYAAFRALPGLEGLRRRGQRPPRPRRERARPGVRRLLRAGGRLVQGHGGHRDSCASLTAEKWPDVPYFLFGHSMGSFLARTHMIRYPEAPLAGVILSGTGQPPEARGGRGPLPLRRRHAQKRPHAPQRDHLQRRLRQLQQGL